MKSALARRGENGNTKLATKCYTTQGRITFIELRAPHDIQRLNEENLAQAAAIKALRLLNQSLSPWHSQPKRRKAVIAKHECHEDADRGEITETATPIGPKEDEDEKLVWKELAYESDDSD